MRSVSKSVISPAGGHCDRSQADRQRRRARRQILSGVLGGEIAGLVDSITLRHLLTMSSGMKWDRNAAWKDPKNDEPHLGIEADPLRYVLSKPVVGTAGCGVDL